MNSDPTQHLIEVVRLPILGKIQPKNKRDQLLLFLKTAYFYIKFGCILLKTGKVTPIVFIQNAATGGSWYYYPELLVELEGVALCNMGPSTHVHIIVRDMEIRIFRRFRIWQRGCAARESSVFVRGWSLEAMCERNTSHLFDVFPNYCIRFAFMGNSSWCRYSWRWLIFLLYTVSHLILFCHCKLLPM